MKIQNLRDLKQMIEKLKSKQSGNLTIEKIGIASCSVTLLRDTPYESFIQMSMVGSIQRRFALTFSVLPNWSANQMKKHYKELFADQKQAFKSLWESAILQEKLIGPNGKTVTYYSLSLAEQCYKIASVTSELFTHSFLKENRCNESELFEDFSKLKSAYDACEMDEKVSFRSNELIIRFEEQMDDLRVILLVDVLTMRIEITYANREEHGVLNPLTEFVDENFSYENYFNFLKRHDLLFLETQGAPQYPLAHNNIQELKLTFSIINDYLSPFDIWARSARAQGLWLKKIIKTLHIFCPESDDEKGIFLDDSECTKLPFLGLPHYSGKSNPTSYSGIRMYTSGLWRIYLQFDTTEEQDDFGHPFNVNFISARVEPFCQNHDFGEGSRYYHPFIYDWEK
jgi:hypothetical protein